MTQQAAPPPVLCQEMLLPPDAWQAPRVVAVLLPQSWLNVGEFVDELVRFCRWSLLTFQEREVARCQNRLPAS